MPKVRYPLLPGVIALGTWSTAMAAPAPVPAPYPGLAQMLLPALLFLVFVLCSIRLAGWAVRRWQWLAQCVDRISSASVLVCTVAVASLMALNVITPLVWAGHAVPGSIFNLRLGAGALALVTAPLAWRAFLRRLAPAGHTEIRPVTRWTRVAWLCAGCGVAALAIAQARLHQPPLPRLLGLFQFGFLSIFLLTLAPVLSRLTGVFRRPTDPSAPSP